MNARILEVRTAHERAQAFLFAHQKHVEALAVQYAKSDNAEKLMLLGRLKQARDELAIVKADAIRFERRWTALRYFAQMVDHYPPPSLLARLQIQIPDLFNTIRETALKQWKEIA